MVQFQAPFLIWIALLYSNTEHTPLNSALHSNMITGKEIDRKISSHIVNVSHVPSVKSVSSE